MHLHGFPPNRGEEFLEYCGEYPYIDDIERAQLYLNIIIESNPAAYIDLAYIAYSQNNIELYDQYIKKIEELVSEEADLVNFNHQYLCYQWNNHPNKDLLYKLNTKPLPNYSNCQPCEILLFYGFRAAQAEIQSLEESGEFDIEEYLIAEQQAENLDEEGIMKLAYYNLVGNEDLGLEANIHAARQIYQAIDNPIANYNLGLLELRQQNYEIAFQYFNKSANQSYAQAYEGLGYMYAHGHYVQQSMEQAKYNYLKAAELGSTQALANVAAFMAFDGQLADAIELLKQLDTDISKFQLVALNLMHNFMSCNESIQLLRQVIQTKSTGSKYSIFKGQSQSDDLFIQFMEQTPGAATKIANMLEDIQLKKQLYQIDSKYDPEALYHLSYIADQEYDQDLALNYINELIRRTHGGDFETVNLIPAFLWKLKLILFHAKQNL